jgi:hypothetical protein
MIKAVLDGDKVIGIVDVEPAFKGFLTKFDGHILISVGTVRAKSWLTKSQREEFEKLLEEKC